MSNENEKKSPKKENEDNNLNEIMVLLLQQYTDFVARKERLENKALGYLTPLSILLAATITIISILAKENIEKTILLFLFIAFFIGQVYYSILTFIFALKAYSVKTSLYLDIKKYVTEKWQIEKASFLGGINNALLEIIDNLNELLKRLVGDVQYCRIFLIFSMVFGIIIIVFFIVYFYML